jgi:hypothetical protein
LPGLLLSPLQLASSLSNCSRKLLQKSVNSN